MALAYDAAAATRLPAAPWRMAGADRSTAAAPGRQLQASHPFPGAWTGGWRWSSPPCAVRCLLSRDRVGTVALAIFSIELSFRPSSASSLAIEPHKEPNRSSPSPQHRRIAGRSPFLRQCARRGAGRRVIDQTTENSKLEEDEEEAKTTFVDRRWCFSSADGRQLHQPRPLAAVRRDRERGGVRVDGLVWTAGACGAGG